MKKLTETLTALNLEDNEIDYLADLVVAEFKISPKGISMTSREGMVRAITSRMTMTNLEASMTYNRILERA